VVDFLIVGANLVVHDQMMSGSGGGPHILMVSVGEILQTCQKLDVMPKPDLLASFHLHLFEVISKLSVQDKLLVLDNTVLNTINIMQSRTIPGPIILELLKCDIPE
jgi:hypothetical protein